MGRPVMLRGETIYFLEAAIAKPRVNDDIRLSFYSVTGHRFALRRDKEAVKYEENAFVALAKRSWAEIEWNIFVGSEMYWSSLLKPFQIAEHAVIGQQHSLFPTRLLNPPLHGDRNPSPQAELYKSLDKHRTSYHVW